MKLNISITGCVEFSEINSPVVLIGDDGIRVCVYNRGTAGLEITTNKPYEYHFKGNESVYVKESGREK